MESLVFTRRFIAVGQKTAATPGWGEGHNFGIEIGSTRELKPTDINLVLQEIDHSLLGVDKDIGVEPELTRLPEWIYKKLNSPAVVEVHCHRGDGAVASFYTQPG